jgi:hypothetical protein
LVALVVLCGTAASTIFHYVMSAYLHRDYPYSTFLFKPGDHFMDFFNVYRQAKEFHPGVSENMVYSPLLHLITTAAGVVPEEVAFGLLVTAFEVVLVLVLWFWTTERLAADRLSRALHVAVLALLPYPVLFVIDRGNLEMAVFIFLAAFFWLYYRRRSGWAFVPLALAIAAKYYWVSLLLLLLLDRQWRQALWSILTALATSLAALIVIGTISGYGVERLIGSIRYTLGGHMDMTGGLGIASHAHSLWTWVVCITRWTDYAFYFLPAQRIYFLMAVLILLVVVRRLARGGFRDWQKATALVACTLVLPFESGDYTLIHLMLPLALFAAVPAWGWRSAVTAAVFGVLMVPIDYYYLRLWGQVSTVSISSLAYPVLLVGLIALALWRREAIDPVSKQAALQLLEENPGRAG